MPKHCIVLGAGISGLSLAWYLQKQGASVTLIEKESRAGGWIETLKEQDFIFDRGPRSCRTRGTGVATLQLIEDLKLEDEMIVASENAKKRYLYLDHTLTALPTNLFSTLFSSVTNGLFKALWKDFFTKGALGHDESIADFVERRLGRSFADRFFDPLVTGIYAGDLHKLSLRACFPFLAEWEAQYGGIVKGILKSKKKKQEGLSPFVQKALQNPIISFKEGMETLPKRLLEKFEGTLLLNETVEILSDDTVTLSSGKVITGDHVFSTLPAYTLKDLLPIQPEIPFASVATVHLGYQKHLPIPEGFGYLIPSTEGERILGVVFDSCVFPQQAGHLDETRLTVMLGNSRIADFDDWTHGQFLAAAQEAISRHLGIEQVPDFVEVKIAKNAIPHYLVGHLDRLAKLEQNLAQRYPRLTLLGNSFYGVSINDCIAKAKLTAADL